MRDAIAPDCMNAWVGKKYLKVITGRWIKPKRRVDIFFN
jgi:hypothetical protein